MKMWSEYQKYFDFKGYSTGKSHTFKKIDNFNKLKIAGTLFYFLDIHPSFRALFQAIVDTGEQTIDPDLIYQKTVSNLKSYDTGILYSVKCKKCNQDVYILNIAEKNFRLVVKDSFHCSKCVRTIFPRKDQYTKLENISKNDLIKFLNAISNNSDMFYSTISLSCIYCDNAFEDIPDISNVSLKCPSCGKIRYVVPSFFLDDKISKFIENKQGYWLEWYIWKRLERFIPFHGIKITKKSNKSLSLDIDICLLKNAKMINIECKDTNNVDDIFKNIPYINQTFDVFVLVTTESVSEKRLEDLKGQITIDFRYIDPIEMDKIEEIIEKF